MTSRSTDSGWAGRPASGACAGAAAARARTRRSRSRRHPPRPGAEEAHQRLAVVLAGAQLDVSPAPASGRACVRSSRAAAASPPAKRPRTARIGGVDQRSARRVSGSSSSTSPSAGTASSIGSLITTGTRSCLRPSDAQRLLVAVDEEVGDQEGHRLPLGHPAAGSRARRAGRCPCPCGLEGEDLAHHPQHVLPALLGRDDLLDPVGEEDAARPGRCSRWRRRRAAPRPRPPSPPSRGPAEPNSSEAETSTSSITVISRSSVKTLTYGVVHARGDVPVDGADVVARLVLAHLGERHAPALEDRVVLAREQRRDTTLRVAISILPDALDELLGQHAASARSRHLDALEDALDDLLGRHLLGLGLVGERDAVAQHVGADRLDVLGRDVAAVAQEGVGPRRQGQGDASRAGWRRTR